jgi:hypothetical protein
MLHKLVRMTEPNILLGFKHSHKLTFSKKLKKKKNPITGLDRP